MTNPLVLWHRLSLALLLAYLPVNAATYHVDPAGGAMTGDGSAAKPWLTLETVMSAKKTFQPGDVILLRNGDHGRVSVRGNVSGGTVTLQAEKGHHPRLAALAFKSAANWTVVGLSITPEGALPSKATVRSLVAIAGDCQDIAIRGCEVASVKSVAGWTEGDWLARAITGIASDGRRTTIAECTIRNVRFGVTLGREARDSRVLRNTIENFMSDGLRGLADACVFEGNTVKNCYKIDDNHDDGFQSWSTAPEGGKVGGGIVKGVVLRGNTFISYTDPNQPFKAAMQGIGCFDGMFEDWVVENNLVVTDMWHGIAFYGATRCRIVNNTVVKNPIDAAARTPWIHVSPHKRGMKSTDNLVRNNLVHTLQVTEGVARVDHNVVMKEPAAYFVDYAHFDFQLKPECSAIGAGAAEEAPATDLTGAKRATPPDVGAYQSK